MATPKSSALELMGKDEERSGIGKKPFWGPLAPPFTCGSSSNKPAHLIDTKRASVINAFSDLAPAARSRDVETSIQEVGCGTTPSDCGSAASTAAPKSLSNAERGTETYSGDDSKTPAVVFRSG